MKIKLLLLCLSIVTGAGALCQKIIISGEETNRKIKWSDFREKVDSSAYDAYTKWMVDFKLNGVRFKQDSTIVANYEVILTYDPQKSWVRKGSQTNYLLLHEQGHFNLGILCMNEMLQGFKDTSFKQAGLQKAIQNFVTAIIEKYDALNLQYDEQTNHGNNKTEQEKWNMFFAENLKGK